MARVRPFAAWRYRSTKIDITSLTAPPYDVISPEQREALTALDSHNVVELELPAGTLDLGDSANRYETGGATWDAWRENGVLVRDESPAVYVLEQRYRLAEKDVRRRAFIVEVELKPFDAGVVLPHERTLPRALGDRFNLTVATRANLSQVFGLFDDSACDTDALFDAAMSTRPIATATDSDGVTSALWAATDPALVAQLQTFMIDRRIFIADGHHRYTTALAYRDRRRAQAAESGEAPADPAYDFVLMALVNMDDPDLIVLPTHRVADAEKPLDAEAFREALSKHFHIEELPQGHAAVALETVIEPAFVVKTRGDATPFLVRLRNDVDLERAITREHSVAWKSLDVAVLQELILDPLLGIHPDRPETLERLSFVKDAHDALKATETHDIAFVLRPTRMDQLRSVASAGETMPQKSTYFYPKLLSGLLFRSAE